MKLTMITIIFLITMSSVSAIGISPAKITIHEGYDKPTFAFNPVLRSYEPGTFHARVEGDLAQYVILDKTDLERHTPIRGHLAALPDVPPGSHDQRIILAFTPQNSAGTVAARIEVAGILEIKIQYPDEYLEAYWTADTDAGSGKVRFTVSLENLGTKHVTPKTISMAFLDDGATSDIVSLTPADIPPGEFAKTETSYDGFAEGKLIPGIYDAALTVVYGARTIEEQKELILGTPRITVTSLQYTDETGPIKPIDVEGDVLWNRPLAGTIEIFLDDNTKPALSTEIEIENQFSERFYLDTQSSGTPEQSIKVVVSAQGVKTEATTLLKEEALPRPRPYMWLGIAFVVLLAIVIWLLRVRRNNS